MFIFFPLWVPLGGCQNQGMAPVPAPSALQIRAADLSFTPEIAAAGTVFFDMQGNARDMPAIFHEAGCNVVRLRLWHTPAGSHSSTAEVVAFAARLRAEGFKLWLDLHYSDSWADPGQQRKPVAWENLGLMALHDSVYAYTKAMVASVGPDYVQIGNEINNGFLWEEGRRTHEAQFVSLLQQAVRAAREVAPRAEIIMHYAGIRGATAFYQLLEDNRVDYDIIGLSYYPLWHGKDLGQLQAMMEKLTGRFARPLLLAEIAYPFTLNWNDYTNNIIGLKSQLLPGYPATPSGQAAYLERVRQMLVTLDGGLGFCYWAPDWVAFRGPTATDGSAWENQALFDFGNKALPGIEVFRP